MWLRRISAAAPPQRVRRMVSPAVMCTRAPPTALPVLNRSVRAAPTARLTYTPPAAIKRFLPHFARAIHTSAITKAATTDTASAPPSAGAAGAAGAATGSSLDDDRGAIVHLDSVGIAEVNRVTAMNAIPQSRVRNFSIIAHIDHGKSTLADRLLEMAGNISSTQRQNTAQFLDKLEVERTRGITVKSKTASMLIRDPTSGDHYLLNLIDTPGHVDFSYEVSRALSACEGALLLVDAAQGIQAQTLANLYTARLQRTDAAAAPAPPATPADATNTATAAATAATAAGTNAAPATAPVLEALPNPSPQLSVAGTGAGAMAIVPVLTKIDLPHAQPDSVAEDMMLSLDVDMDAIIRCSAKTGFGIQNIFASIIRTIPPPIGNADAPFRALLFDSWYDVHRGVICLVKVLDGAVTRSDRIAMYHTGGVYEVQEVGLLMPEQFPVTTLRTGQVGYFIAGIKQAKEVRLGDTIYSLPSKAKSNPLLEVEAKQKCVPLAGFRPAKSMVFAGLFPAQSSDFEELRTAVEKLTLNDASVGVQKESSVALGLGFRCGFLGLLHMHVFSARLEQEFGAPVIITAPTVPYKAQMMDGSEITIDSPSNFPSGALVKEYLEPIVKATLTCPDESAHPLIAHCRAHRGELLEHTQIGGGRTLLRFKLPFAEIVTQFYDRIKSISSGYASFDYEPSGYEPAALVKLDIRINGESVDALSLICARAASTDLGRDLVAKLKENIDRQNFEIIIQAAVGSKILSRERIAPYRKDVLTKGGKTVGGGDMTRKRKLLDKQKEGKKKMKMVGNVELDDKVFLAVLKTSDT